MSKIQVGETWVKVLKLHPSGHADVKIYRGDTAVGVAIAEWRDTAYDDAEASYGSYFLWPTNSARMVSIGDSDGLYVSSLKGCLSHAYSW